MKDWEEAMIRTLFELVAQVLSAECGDGDIQVDCKRFSKEDLAELFEVYVKDNNLGVIHRFNNEWDILFSDKKDENVIFANASDHVSPPSYGTALHVSI